MDKYAILESKNEYINYTINNYLNCYDDLNDIDIPLFTELFGKLQDHKISIGNCLVDGMPIHGIKLDMAEKTKTRDCDDLVRQLETISTSISPENKKDALFFQSVSHLCQSISHLDNMEMMYLNEVFQTVSERKQSISADAINDGQTFFFPYNRYPTKIK